MVNDRLRVFERDYPSANSVLLLGPRPVLVDTGYGSGASELAPWLRAQGVAPERLAAIVNTHFHTDHAGGNFALQQEYGLDIHASEPEAALVNARDPDACRATWLVQPIEPYTVAKMLREGDVIDTGLERWRVLATPGHTAGHLSLVSGGVLVLGDAAHGHDVGWVSPYVEGADTPRQAAESLRRLAALGAHTAISGHGPVIADPARALARALARLDGWADAPERMAWHAAKRIFAHHLIVTGGLDEPRSLAYLAAAPWARDHAAGLGESVPAFAAALLREMVRADAATWRDGVLHPTARFRPPDPGWPRGPVQPSDWPLSNVAASPSRR